jgi:hypothetical protein
MKKLDLVKMENVHGGKLTGEEIDAFLGAAGCVLTGAGGVAAIFGGASCARWIYVNL